MYLYIQYTEMINPKFHLQSLKDKNGNLVDSPILLLFSVNGKRIQYYTQCRVPEKWQVKTGKYPSIKTCLALPKSN